MKGKFSLEEADAAPNPNEIHIGSQIAPWAGKAFKGLKPAEKKRLTETKLPVVEITKADPGEVEDLFVRLQGGTPLTAQEKRDAWPGDFTHFVIRHAGKPDHPESDPHPFFELVKKGGRKRRPGTDEEDNDDFHYLDPLVDTRKLFAQIAMTIMLRETEDIDIVDLSGKGLNSFYLATLALDSDSPEVVRVLNVLEVGSELPGFAELTQKPLNGNVVFHFAMLLDTLLSGDKYVQSWRKDYVRAFSEFMLEVQKARDAFKKERQRSVLYDDFAVPLAGSGSDKADAIRRRHMVFADWMYKRLNLKTKDPKRLFDPLEREIVWERDGRACKNPKCEKPIPFHEATVHHVDEHQSAGPTVYGNGVCVCKGCSPKLKELRAAEAEFKAYLRSLSERNAEPKAANT